MKAPQSDLPRSLLPHKASLISATIPWSSSQGDLITESVSEKLVSESSFILEQDIRNWQLSISEEKKKKSGFAGRRKKIDLMTLRTRRHFSNNTLNSKSKQKKIFSSFSSHYSALWKNHLPILCSLVKPLSP